MEALSKSVNPIGADIRCYDGENEFLVGPKDWYPEVADFKKFIPDHRSGDEQTEKRIKRLVSPENPRKRQSIFYSYSRDMFFGEHVSREELEAILRLIGVGNLDNKAFLVFAGASKDTRRDLFINYARCVTNQSLCYDYGLVSEMVCFRSMPSQHMMGLADYLWSFIQWQKEELSASKPPLKGCLGCDGERFTETLCFWIKAHGEYGTVDICSVPRISRI